MNQKDINGLLIALIRIFLTGRTLEEGLSGEDCEAVSVLAHKHDVAHLVGEVMSSPRIPFVEAKRKAIYRYVQQDYIREQIFSLFEQEEIAFIPLKGSVINTMYPEAWLRTSCDIDILIHSKDLSRAEQSLRERLGFVFHKKSAYDVSLMSVNGVHLELHYDFEECEIETDEIWNSAVSVQEGCNRHIMSGEYFLLHHIAHMAKHFRSGGCGLRPFVDLWFLRERMDYDQAGLDRLLFERGLKPFADAVFGLLDFWFGEGKTSPVLEAMAEYILPAGVYGSIKNKVAVGQIDKGSKANYFISRLFQSKASLEYPYPILKKHGWLLPFCQVHRWYKLLADGKINRITTELSANSSMENTYRDNVRSLLRELNL